MNTIYNQIGIGYAHQRRTDPKIAARIHGKLGNPKTLLNVGAGTGSYEPADCHVVAIEPSQQMIDQRAPDAAPVIFGAAENIPFADKQFDAAMAILTVHHWTNLEQGLAEMRRVARKRLVLLTYDPDFSGFWLEEYIPDLLQIDRHQFVPMDYFRNWEDDVEIEAVPIPHDCHDGFLCAYWRRPHAYLDPTVRASISTFSKVDDGSVRLDRLEGDLASGAWERKYSDLLTLEELDLGYRLITVNLTS